VNEVQGLNLAREYANNSKMSPWKLGAIIVRDNRVIGKGYNKYSGKIKYFNSKFNMQLWSLHAEMMAILSCDGPFDDAIMYVAGVKSNGNPINCKPCKYCQKIIKSIGIRVIYETKEGWQGL
jgi:deoxycytidylate deaminase